MKKRILAVMMAAVMVLGVTACGSKTETQQSSTTQTTETKTETTQTETTPVATEEPATEEVTETGYPYTVTVSVFREHDGATFEDTYEKAPEHVVVSGYQMLYILLDLGLEDRIDGMLAAPDSETKHDCVSDELIAKADKIPRLGKSDAVSKEQLVEMGCDFLMGWDSLFSDKNYDQDFCNQYGIHMYFPYCCYDAATFEDIYKDYEVLGRIFGVEDVAAEKVANMKAIMREVETALADVDEPITILNYDSGEDDVFTGCQGMPGNMFKLAGGISLFDDIDKGWARVSWEEIVARNPQVIIFNNYSTTQEEYDQTMDFLMNQPSLQATDAVKNGRVFGIALDPLEGSAGSAQAVYEMAKFLYPDKFN